MMTELTRYPDPESFLAVAGESLYANEPLHSLMIGVVERLTGNLHFYGEGDPYLAVVTDGGTPVLAGTMTPPFGLLVSALREDPEGFIPLLVSDLIGSDWALPDVHAETRYALQFAEEWATQAGGSYHKDMDMRIYVLHQVTPPEDVPGKFMQATTADQAQIAEWLGGFHIEAMAETRTDDQLEKSAAALIERCEGYIWWDEGRPVSMCLRTRPTKTGISVGGVFTPSELRGRGYASACVAALSQLMLDEGYQFTSLFTDLANPTSNSIYMKIGYQPLADFDKYKLVGSD